MWLHVNTHTRSTMHLTANSGCLTLLLRGRSSSQLSNQRKRLEKSYQHQLAFHQQLNRSIFVVKPRGLKGKRCTQLTHWQAKAPLPTATINITLEARKTQGHREVVSCSAVVHQTCPATLTISARFDIFRVRSESFQGAPLKTITPRDSISLCREQGTRRYCCAYQVLTLSGDLSYAARGE